MCVCYCSGLVITMVASLLFILLLRYTAGAFLWVIIVGVIAAVAYGAYALKAITQIAALDLTHNFYSGFLACFAVNISSVMANYTRFWSFSLSLRYLALLLGIQYAEEDTMHQHDLL